MAKRPNSFRCRVRPVTYSLYVVLAYEYFESCDLFERLLMVNCHHQTPAQVTCAHCQRSRTSASAPRPFLLPPRRNTFAEASRTSYKGFRCRQHPVMKLFTAAADQELGSGSMILAGLLQDSKRHFTISSWLMH